MDRAGLAQAVERRIRVRVKVGLALLAVRAQVEKLTNPIPVEGVDLGHEGLQRHEEMRAG
jgi:hypothetical protein